MKKKLKTKKINFFLKDTRLQVPQQSQIAIAIT